MLAKNKAKRSSIIHASILLQAESTCGWTNAAMAAAYEVSTKKVEPLQKRFVAEGFEAALYRTPVTHAHRRTIPGDEAAHVIALACRAAPAGHERWTFRRRADQMVEWAMVDAVSHETRRRT
jgi:hypothetical protein